MKNNLKNIFVIGLLLAAIPSSAAQHDYNIANDSGANVRTDINNALAAIQSLNSGATSPISTVAHMLWYDTTDSVIKKRNSTNDDWELLVDVLTTSDGIEIPDGSVGTPALRFGSDTDTGIYQSATGDIAFTNNGALTALFAASSRKLRMWEESTIAGGEIEIRPGSSFSGSMFIDQLNDTGRIFWNTTANKTLSMFNAGTGSFALDIGGVAYLESYTVATVPSAATAGGLIYVSDEAGGATLAFSDGTNWRRVQDRAIISAP